MKNELQYEKVWVSYFVELPQSNFPDYTNSPTSAEFPDISWIPEIPKVVTMHNVCGGKPTAVCTAEACSEQPCWGHSHDQQN